MSAKILFCTVGGSHQPIVTAIEQIQPDFVYFLCTTGAPAGSDRQITGSGMVIKAQYMDSKATLPNIPAQVGLQAEQFAVVVIDPDHLDRSFNVILNSMHAAEARFPGGTLIADYTGGTKGMTVALVMAALEKNTQLHLVTGARADLIKVTDGTQLGMPVEYESIRLRREMTAQLSLWQQYAFGQAQIGLCTIRRPSQNELQRQLLQAHTISGAFDCWDRFDHLRAQQLLASYRPVAGKHYARYYMALDVLTGATAKKEPALIYDLWLNALRRAAQGRYDDAVLRVYRVLEWVAQWGLKHHCQVDAGNLPEDFIPDTVTIYKNHKGIYQAPSYLAWQLLAAKSSGALARFFQQYARDLLGKLNLRNSSILAHGFEPIDRTTWVALEQWMTAHFWPYFQEEAQNIGLKKLPPQLPDRYDIC